MGDLTKNFSLYEFRQRNPTRPVPDGLVPNCQRLADNLQVLRDEEGPITINSAWRSLAKNTEIGGAEFSQHLFAKAADFNVVSQTNKDTYCTILRLIDAGKMEQGGLGWYGERTATRVPHLHYDVRGYKRRWNKTNGPIPVCPEIAPPVPQEEEDDDVAFVLAKNKTNPKVYYTNWLQKRWVNKDERDACLVLGVQFLDPVPKFMEALLDRAKEI